MAMKINPGRLKEYVDVVEIRLDNSGSYPEEKEFKVFESKCRFDEVWMRDYQSSLTTNTVNELKVFMRYDDRINTKMMLRRERDGKLYEIKNILFDETDRVYMNVLVERVEE